MKILIISNLFPPHFIGGYELSCRDTSDLLIENGHDCFILASDFNYPQNFGVSERATPEARVSRTLKLHASWGILNNHGSVSEVSAWNYRQTFEAINQFKPDFIYCWNLYGLTLSPMDAVLNSKLPVTTHIMDWCLKSYGRTLKQFAKRLIKGNEVPFENLKKKLNNSIFPSNFTASRFPLSKSGVHNVIYPFLDFSKFPKPKSKYQTAFTDRKSVPKGVYLGQLEDHKGITVLAEAVRIVNEDLGEPFRLDIYGKGTTGRKEFLEVKYGKWLTLFENVPRSKIFEKLESYDVGFFPSVWEEHFGIAQIELMASGLPIIASGRGGSVEALTESNCIRFESGNSRSLANKLLELLKGYSNLAPQLGLNASQYVREHFNSEIYLKKLTLHFNEVVKQALKKE